MSVRSILLAFGILTGGTAAVADSHVSSGDLPQTLTIYIDADFSASPDPANSIELGLRSALASQDYSIAGFGIELVPLDHRGNARRSIANLRQFDADESGIAVIGGMHSPPYIQHHEEINERRIPLLLAWSAGGMLTRTAEGPQNWIFRLSVDDRVVGPFLAQQMLDGGCERIGIAVVDNTWGLGNLASISAALQTADHPHLWETSLSVELGAAQASSAAQEIVDANLDCVAMVTPEVGGEFALNALYETGHPIRVFSHWGILGRSITEAVPHDRHTSLGLAIVQTCGLDPARRNEDRLDAALTAAAASGSVFETLSDVPAPAGFVHGHDIGQILIAAIEQAAAEDHWDRSAEDRRWLLHQALENLEAEVPGILRTYSQPFELATQENEFAHEALSSGDLCMAQFDEAGRLISTVIADAQ